MACLSGKRSREEVDGLTNKKEKKVKNANRYLTYDVLRIIFRYLNGMELSKAAMVCRSWLEVASDEKRTRGGFTYLTHNLKQGMELFRTRIIKKLQIKPILGLFFCKPLGEPYSDQDCHRKVLPRNCDAITLGTYGVLMDNKEIENATDEVVCVCLPEVPSIKIKTVTITALQGSEQYYSQMNEAVSQLKNSNYKCLLLFCNQRGRQPACAIAEKVRAWNKTVHPSIWGGAVNDLRIWNSKQSKHKKCAESAICIGVVLSGSVDTWSVVVDYHCNTKELVEQRLTLFKKHVTLRKHSMGFMFACCARGENLFGEKNVESTIFKKLFPEVPLVGCFGSGEFGESVIPSGKKKKGHVYNEGSTAFLIITYG